MRCPVFKCGASIKSRDHKTCPYHSPCHQSGTYDPVRCPSCSAHMATLANTHPDDIPSSPAGRALAAAVRHLRHAVFRAPHLVELEIMDQRIIDWFPSAALGSQAYADIERPRTPGRDMGPTTSSPHDTQGPNRPIQPLVPSGPSVMDRIDALEQSVQKLSSVPDQLQVLLAAVQTPSEPTARRSRSTSVCSSGSSRQHSSSPPRKAPRQAAPNSFHGSSARTRVLSTSSSSAGDLDDEFESDDEPEPTGHSSPPPASGNWQPLPSDWECRPVDGSWVAFGPPPVDTQEATTSTPEEPILVPYHEYEIYTYFQGADRTHWFRPRTHSSHATRTLRERANQVPAALASLSAWVKGAPAPCPSVSLSGHGRRMDGCDIKGVTVSPALGLNSMSETWAAKAAGDKSSGKESDDTRNDPKPVNQTWPESSAERKVFRFLQESTLDHKIVPGGLTTPSDSVIKKDKDNRATALRLLQVNADIDILSNVLGAATSSHRPRSAQDTQTILSSTRVALDGISALLAPLTRDMLKEAITQRVTLREKAIPEDKAPLKPQLLNLEPLSPFLYGPRETVSTLINSMPLPAVVEIKGISNNMWRPASNKNGQGKGNGNNPPKSKNQSGGGKGNGSHQNRSNGSSNQSGTNKKPFPKSGNKGGQKNNNKNSSNSGESKSSSSNNKKN